MGALMISAPIHFYKIGCQICVGKVVKTNLPQQGY